MKIALLGYGRMGQAIEQIAINRGHDIVIKTSQDNGYNIKDADVAIDFSIPNAAFNNIDNCVFYAGDMKNVFNAQFIEDNGTPDVIITDPPRDGMHKDVVQQILNIAPQKVVYVSCNSATQARDLALMDANYKVTRMQPVDMFPQTHHVENVVCLELR